MTTGLIKHSLLVPLEISRIIGPMQQGLALARPTKQIALHAVFPNLGNVASHCLPPLDLPWIILATATHIVTAVPLEPAAGVVRPDPAFFLPVRQGLRRIDAKEIELVVGFFRAQLRVFEPLGRKLVPAIVHVLAAEDPHAEHLGRGQVWLELRMKIFTLGLGQRVTVAGLHSVIDTDRFQIWT